MRYTVDPHATIPPSRQLVEAVLDAMARGDLAPGDRLPSVRAMAQEALVNPNTVGKAYRELEYLGVVLGRNGSGVFVTEDGVAIAQRQRRAATLASFSDAARGALLTGHDEADLIEMLGEVIAATVARVSCGAEETPGIRK